MFTLFERLQMAWDVLTQKNFDPTDDGPEVDIIRPATIYDEFPPIESLNSHTYHHESEFKDVPVPGEDMPPGTLVPVGGRFVQVFTVPAVIPAQEEPEGDERGKL